MSFNKKLFLNGLTKQVEAKANNVVKNILEKVVDDLMYLSPVGWEDGENYPVSKNYEAGKYKANWQYGFNTKKTNELEEFDPSRAMITCATGTKLKSEIKANKSVIGTHHFTNNVPYASIVEYGGIAKGEFRAPWAIYNNQSLSTPYAVVGLTAEMLSHHIREANRSLK